MVPFLVMAAVVGLSQVRDLLRMRSRRELVLPLCGGLLLLLLSGSHLLHGGSPLAIASSRYSAAQFGDDSEAEALRTAIAAVPAGASVAARPGPLAHLADRPRVISPPEYDDGQPVDIVLTPDAAPSTEARIGNQKVTPY